VTIPPAMRERLRFLTRVVTKETQLLSTTSERLFLVRVPSALRRPRHQGHAALERRPHTPMLERGSKPAARGRGVTLANLPPPVRVAARGLA
jgi:hypothetical protein